MLFWRSCNDMQTYFVHFGHASLHTIKMIASTCRWIWCLCNCQKQTSSLLLALPLALKIWNYFSCKDHNLMESINPLELEKHIYSIYVYIKVYIYIYIYVYIYTHIIYSYNIDYKMCKMKAIENKSLQEINPNLDELLRGSFVGGREWGKGNYQSKTR